jgi:hypothetical protein
MHAHFFTYLEKMVSTQFTYRYQHFAKKDAEATIQILDASRRISEVMLQDSSSIKTVAYLTLVFLPATFVSAVFSTSIFDFKNMHDTADANRVVSSGWWIFVFVW